MDDKKVYQGLCIDGGGILGVGAARALMEFEQESGKPIIEQFDYIAGTSTGAILAVLLSLGFTAEDCYRLYKEKGKDIFYIPNLIWKFNPLKPKYSNEKFIKLLDDLLGTKSMKDLKIPTYVATSNIIKKETHVFNRTRTPDDLLKDVILKTTAAPTYFPSQGEWVDGGLWANDPSLMGTLGFKRYKSCEFKDIRVLSIGTGGDTIQKPFDTSKMTLVHWIKPLLDFLFTGLESANEFYMRNLGLHDYERVDPTFNKEYVLDDISKMDMYSTIWENLYKSNKETFEKFFR